MKMSHGGESMAEINITPMIDILLVLLILFLVLQPALSRGIDLQLPAEEQGDPVHRDQIVLHVRPGPTYSLDGVPVSPDELPGRLDEIFSRRTRKVLFLEGHGGILYQDILTAADIARGRGVAVLGLVTRETTLPAGFD